MKTIFRILFILMFTSVPTKMVALADEAWGDSIVSVKEMRQIRRADLSKVQDQTTSFARSNFAIRTNILRWVTFTPEVGLIWHIDPKWDLLFNIGWSSASWHLLERRYGLWYVSPEIRRFFYEQERWYFGGKIEVSKRHYKFTDKGREGWIFGGGIVGGYQWRLSRRTSLDLNLGVGYNGGNLRNYDLDVYFEGQKPPRTYRGKDYYQYIGINHVGVSLVWDL